MAKAAQPCCRKPLGETDTAALGSCMTASRGDLIVVTPCSKWPELAFDQHQSRPAVQVAGTGGDRRPPHHPVPGAGGAARQWRQRPASRGEVMHVDKGYVCVTSLMLSLTLSCITAEVDAVPQSDDEGVEIGTCPD